MDTALTPPAPLAPLIPKWIDTEADFARLEAEWNPLVAAAELDSVFLRHEWVDAAWQWLKLDGSVRILRLYQGDGLVGICPLMIHVTKVKGFAVRELRFLQVPDTQACDVISAARDRGRVCQALLRELHSIRGAWDVLVLDRIPGASSSLRELPEAFRASGLAHRALPDNPNPNIALRGTWDEYYARRSRRLRKGNNLIRNHLTRDFRKIDLERIPASAGSALAAGTDAIAAAMGEMIGISAKSWKQETGLSLDQPGPGAFIRRLTAHAARLGWLSIWLLRLDGQAAAMEYQLAYAGQIHALRSDFDAAYNEHSPGTYLSMEMLKALIGSDAERYLMGPGENAYKLRWAEEFAPLGGFTAYSPSLRGRLFGFIHHKIADPAKRFRDGLKKRPDAGAAPSGAAPPEAEADGAPARPSQPSRPASAQEPS